MSNIRAAVIGTGYLGRFHAQKYAAAPGCTLVGVVDPRHEVRAAVAAEMGTRGFADHRELLGQVDAVSVVTTTPAHYAIARDFLEAGAHVLVEKPITETVEQAESLITIAAAAGRILQVGHLERFNPAIVAAESRLHGARFIECQRLAPFKERGTDVNVVLDLMIHDIDIVQSIVGRPVDIANARLRFEGGCVANVTASRVSLKTERKMRVFRDDAYLSIDLQQRILTVIGKRSGVPAPGELPVTIEESSYDQGDALRAEIHSFLDCIREGKPPLVSGEDGLRALDIAIRITSMLTKGQG
jgi:predicted dehydrogenase